ncbi:MAG: NAD(P)-dependent oxidoreductase [Thaumarchaeota archaeon]|nr:NAD(P)-dependent oxidoreductase [Nitrososphaerota archaeon]
MIERVAITGVNGTIGTVLRKGLTDFEIVPLDLPEADVRDLATLVRLFKGCDAAVHLAWDLKTDNWDTGKISPDNALMTYNVYQACIEAGVRRAIMASSVHADDFMRWKGGLMTPDGVPTPTSPYGANKVLLEAMGRHYATRGLEVVCVRFGAVNKDNRPTVGTWDWRKAWLSHEDCIALVRACLNASSIPGNYALIYGVSDNRERVHDWSNPFGWIPLSDAYAQGPKAASKV